MLMKKVVVTRKLDGRILMTNGEWCKHFVSSDESPNPSVVLDVLVNGDNDGEELLEIETPHCKICGGLPHAAVIITAAVTITGNEIFAEGNSFSESKIFNICKKCEEKSK